jgi:integrase/recombinase XerD
VQGVPAREPGADRFDEVLAEYHTWLAVERGLAPNSRSAYARDLGQYVAFVRLRKIDDPGAVTEPVVQAYAATLRDARNDEGRPRYAAATVARRLVAVRSFHRFCVDEGIAEHDPTDELGTPRVPQGLPKALTEPEVEALLGAVEGDDPVALRDRAILETLYGTGIRIGELCGLDRADLDLYDGTVRVLGKGSKERIVPLGRVGRAAVDAYLRRARPVLEATGPGRRSAVAGDPVFLNGRGARLSRTSCWHIVRNAGRRAGLGDRLSPHVLRHSCATHMLDHGADIRVVQELLGHVSISTTQIYTKVSAERLRAVYESAHPRARA